MQKDHNNQDSPPKHPMDKPLFLLTLTLLVVGIVTVYSASYPIAIENHHGDSFYYVRLQAAWAFVGLIVLVVARYIPYWKWRKVAVRGIAFSALLLVAVLIPHIGIIVNGARRWVGHGGFRIQPSELAKLTLVLYLAHVTANAPKLMRQFKMGFLPPLIVIGILAVLTAKEPDLGTAMVLGGTGLVMLYLAGARPKHMGVTLAAVVGVVTLYAITASYRLHRLTAFLNPRAARLSHGYQDWHSLLALGSGGMFGTGLGEGREKLYIPAARTDFIFSVIAEEWGLIGTVTLVLLFALLAARGYSIAHKTKDPFAALFAAGVTTTIALQSFLNIAVATAFIPNTGVPLPFLSYGGSSLVLMMAGIGILLNISCHPDGPSAAAHLGKPGRKSLAPSELVPKDEKRRNVSSVRDSSRRPRPIT